MLALFTAGLPPNLLVLIACCWPSGWWASVERSGRKGFQISHLNTLIYDLNSIFNFRVESFPTLLSTH